MQTLTTISSAIWLYGTWLALAIGVGSVFMATFFFFWTRTVGREKVIDLETKYLYINPLYSTIRIATAVLLVSKILEIFYLITFAKTLGVEVTFLDMFTSHVGLPMYGLVVILSIVALGTYLNKMSLFYAIPLAVVSWVFLLVSFVRSNQYTIDAYFVPAQSTLGVYVVGYVLSFIVFMAVFNWARLHIEKK